MSSLDADVDRLLGLEDLPEDAGSGVNRSGAKSQLTFDDLTRLQNLLGPGDRNLSLIEKHLGVEIVASGNHLRLRGPKRDIAMRFLQHHYDANSGPLGAGEIGPLLSSMEEMEGHDLEGVSKASVHPGLKISERSIRPRTVAQSRCLQLIDQNRITFAIGPAGTGKTFLAVAKALEALIQKRVRRVILSRPALEAGEQIGFLPGDMREKIDPYLKPLFDALNALVDRARLDRWLDRGTIEIAPIGFMRGRTLDGAFAILDEAQNLLPMQMKMFLTRLGEGSHFVICGDPTQSDLGRGQRSGLRQALERLDGLDEIAIARFRAKDVVRESLVAKIVEAYEGA